MKYLIVGLGNIGSEYEHTRHNIGFDTVDKLAENLSVSFDINKRYGAIAKGKIKNCQLVILKPFTYMNESGKAIRYWMQKDNITIDHLLVVVDDLALPFGTIRLRGKGSDAGHNGLKSIQELIHSQNYARLRFGIGNDFVKGGQVNYVLSRFTDEEQKAIGAKIEIAVDCIKSFCLEGLTAAMNRFNNK
ncbi:peptidyl-tRNA hydrolase [Porphyromonadaceae bacterium COT-184 OH4590]|nr:peptidyl-tRNA hydrolase [Porphyromonadaceae bacterium COT-184 OH4590]